MKTVSAHPPSWLPFCASAAVFLWGVIWLRAAANDTSVSTVRLAPAIGKNGFYTGNRPPLTPRPLIKLPIGAIQPEGWLREQLRLEADGYSGHLSEISKWCKFEGSAWASSKGQGEFGWEELPYWLKGYVDLGYVVQDPRIMAEGRRWIDAIVASQRANGYFGSEANLQMPDIWPNMIVLYALRSHYEASGDKRVLPFMTKYFRWLQTVPSQKLLPDSWQKWRGGDNLDGIYWLYNRTGEKWLLALAQRNHERTADWTSGIPTWHGVNISQGFREPGEFFQQSHDRRHWNATVRNYETVMDQYGQVPGGMFGADENARPGFAGPRQGAETCTMAEFMWSDEMLMSISGESIWGDRCEEIAFNSLPASMTSDLKGLHYLTCPNVVQLDRRNKAPMVENEGDMFSFNPHDYRCCQHNSAFAWPYFAEHLWMATPNNGLAATLYAPSVVRAKVGPGTTVQIAETTHYPFDETVAFVVSTPRPVRFPLELRVPGWCGTPQVSVNGGSTSALSSGQGGWLVLERNWRDGDRVQLQLPMAVVVRVWGRNKNAVSVDRGPLTYSLRIGERWQRYGGTDQWPALEVFPTTPWNYGLEVDLNDPSRSFAVEKRSAMLAAQPFTVENAPIQLKAKGRRIPEWKQEPNGFIQEIQPSPVRAHEPLEEVILIPMGCARLRLTAFPWIGEGAEAHSWR